MTKPTYHAAYEAGYTAGYRAGYRAEKVKDAEPYTLGDTDEEALAIAEAEKRAKP